MPTLVQRNYFEVDAAIPPSDFDVELGIFDIPVGITYSNYLESGIVFPVVFDIPNLSGSELEQVFTQTISSETHNGSELNITIETRASVITINGFRYNWPNQPWPEESWEDFVYRVGDFSHELIED